CATTSAPSVPSARNRPPPSNRGQTLDSDPGVRPFTLTPVLGAAGAQVEGLGDLAPVEGRHALVVVSGVQHAVGEGAGAGLVQPDAVGQGHVLAGEAAQVAQFAAVGDVEDGQVGVLVGGDPVAAAVRAGPQGHALGLGGEAFRRQVAAGV